MTRGHGSVADHTTVILYRHEQSIEREGDFVWMCTGERQLYQTLNDNPYTSSTPIRPPPSPELKAEVAPHDGTKQRPWVQQGCGCGQLHSELRWCIPVRTMIFCGGGGINPDRPLP